MATGAEVAPRILFDGDHVQLLHFDRSAPRLLISFDIMHARANGSNGFARTLCARLGYGLLAIVPKYPCWYPAEEMRRIAGLCEGRLADETIAYGASMGGYGALRWGKALGAGHVLACSPQASINPDFTGNRDRRYHRYFRPELHRGMEVRPDHLPGNSLVLFDPTFKPDGFHGGALAALEGVTVIPVPHTRHGTVRCLAGTSIAQDSFDDLIRQDFRAIRRRMLMRRKTLPSYRLHLADAALVRRRYGLAASIAAPARETDPVAYQMLMGKLARLSGDNLAAAEHFRAALALKPRCSQASYQLARLNVADEPIRAEGGAG